MFIYTSCPGQCTIVYIVMIVISFVLLCILLYSFVVWCNKVIIKKIKKYARNRKRAACMFFRSAKTRVLNKAWSPVRRSRFLKARFDELTITKITRKVNAPNIRRLKSARTVIVNSSNPAHSARDLRTGDHACLTRASTGKTNY